MFESRNICFKGIIRGSSGKIFIGRKYKAFFFFFFFFSIIIIIIIIIIIFKWSLNIFFSFYSTLNFAETQLDIFFTFGEQNQLSTNWIYECPYLLVFHSVLWNFKISKNPSLWNIPVVQWLMCSTATLNSSEFSTYTLGKGKTGSPLFPCYQLNSISTFLQEWLWN